MASSLPFPIGIPIGISMPIIQQVQLYLLKGFLYIRTTQYSTDLSCYHENHTRCHATVITNDETGQAWLFSKHSHSQPSAEFLKELEEADNYNIVHLSHEVISCTSVTVKLRAPLECKYCHTPFHDFDLFQRHIKRHERQYKPHWMAQKSAKYRTHAKQRAKLPVKRFVYYKRVQSAPNKEPSYQCKYCLEDFPSAMALQNHEESQPFQCDRCNTCFSSVSSYLGHSHNNLPRKQHRSLRRNLRPVRHVQTVLKDTTEERVVLKETTEETELKTTEETELETTEETELETTGETEMETTEETELDMQENCSNWTINYYKCQFCSKKYESRAALLEHNSTYPIYCNICQTCLPSVSEFLKHETIHKRFAKKDVFCKKCTFCNETFSSKARMRSHVCLQLNFDKFHVDINSDKPTYKCKHCALVCQSYKQLITHATYKCKRKAGRSNESTEADPDYSSSTSSSLTGKQTKRGMKKAKKQYPCKECGKHFIRKRESVECFESHNTEFKCPLCNIPFDSEAKVSEHIADSHACRYCEEQGKGTIKFTRPFYLQVHIKHYHQVLCPHCKKEFTSQKLVFEHVLDEHKCKYCKYNYLPSKEALIQHERGHGMLRVLGD